LKVKLGLLRIFNVWLDLLTQAPFRRRKGCTTPEIREAWQMPPSPSSSKVKQGVLQVFHVWPELLTQALFWQRKGYTAREFCARVRHGKCRHLNPAPKAKKACCECFMSSLIC